MDLVGGSMILVDWLIGWMVSRISSRPDEFRSESRKKGVDRGLLEGSSHVSAWDNDRWVLIGWLVLLFSSRFFVIKG